MQDRILLLLLLLLLPRTSPDPQVSCLKESMLTPKSVQNLMDQDCEEALEEELNNEELPQGIDEA